MALQMVVDSLDGMDEGISKLYVEKDGKFHLDIVDGHVKNDDPNRIPKARLDAEISKRRESEQTLTEIAEGFVNDVPEEMRDIIPDLPPAKKIKWIQSANAKGLFNPKGAPAVDVKRPGDKVPKNFDPENVNPFSLIESGLKNIKK